MKPYLALEKFEKLQNSPERRNSFAERVIMVSVTKELWSENSDKEIFLYCVSGGSLAFKATNFGCALQSLTVKKGTRPVDVVLGYDSAKEYEQDKEHMGVVVGRYADLVEDASFVLRGKRFQLEQNCSVGCMHSGSGGFDKRVWRSRPLADGVEFSLFSDDGDGGFPSGLEVYVSYRIVEDNAFQIEYVLHAHGETPVSLTNHTYFNLDETNNIENHTLFVNSDRYAETSCKEEPVVTGKLACVDGTPLDFRSTAKLKDRLCSSFEEISAAGGLDHFFCVDGSRMREMATLCGASGLKMTCSGDTCGVLIYTANNLKNSVGKGHVKYGCHAGICLETGFIPNAVNFSSFSDSVIMQAGQTRKSATRFSFD